ncbi:MAG: hypothetical protein GTO13_01770 [Proteobacteria bacterium]|nr:hypothetical protein [Pseudomonadota bacterium]
MARIVDRHPNHEGGRTGGYTRTSSDAWRLILEIPPIEGAIILLNRIGECHCQQIKG